MAVQERQAELAAMENSDLIELCDKAGVDPLLKEVMVDRLIKHEGAAGRFARPETHNDEEMEDSTKEGKADLVDAVLADEKKRKKQNDLKRKHEEAEEKKRNEVQSMSVDELKKVLTKKGQDATGKKSELVETLMAITKQEEALAARRTKLRALGIDELRSMLTERNVKAPQKKDAMISAIFEHDERTQREVEAHKARAMEMEAKKKEELQGHSANELKDMCAAKGLRLGRNGDERVATLLEAARADGEIDRLVTAAMRDARKDELLAMDKEALKALCDPAGIDVMVKDVVIERILSHESENGRVAVGAEDGKPPAKKAKKR
jgi:hypothetical protein